MRRKALRLAGMRQMRTKTRRLFSRATMLPRHVAWALLGRYVRPWILDHHLDPRSPNFDGKMLQRMAGKTGDGRPPHEYFSDAARTVVRYSSALHAAHEPPTPPSRKKGSGDACAIDGLPRFAGRKTAGAAFPQHHRRRCGRPAEGFLRVASCVCCPSDTLAPCPSSSSL